MLSTRTLSNQLRHCLNLCLSIYLVYFNVIIFFGQAAGRSLVPARSTEEEEVRPRNGRDHQRGS